MWLSQSTRTKANATAADRTLPHSTTEIPALANASLNALATKTSTTGSTIPSVDASATNKSLLLAIPLPASGVKELATVSARRDGVLRDTSRTRKHVFANARGKTALKELFGILLNVSAIRNSVENLNSALLSRAGILFSASVFALTSQQSFALLEPDIVKKPANANQPALTQ